MNNTTYKKTRDMILNRAKDSENDKKKNKKKIKRAIKR